MITDVELREVIAESLKGRQNAHKRALRKDAEAALRGDACCRESVAERFTRRVLVIHLTPDLAAAIDRYLDTDWRDGRDPSRIGALNAVAHIGEQVAGIYARTNGRAR